MVDKTKPTFDIIEEALNNIKNDFVCCDTLSDERAHEVNQALAALKELRERAEDILTNVYCNTDCVQKFSSDRSFWDKQPYGNRFYFGNGALDYITPSHVDTMIAAFKLLHEANGGGDD